MKTNASANRWPTASLERFAHLPMCGEGTRWEIVEKIQCEMFPRLSFSPSCRWCRACFDWDERDPPILSLLKPNDRAASVADGIQPKHPSAPWLDWPSPADHWNYSAVSSSFFFFFPSSGKKQPSMFYGSILRFLYLGGKQSLLKFRHPARTLPGRMHWN